MAKILVIGDIHGRYQTFANLRDKVSRDTEDFHKLEKVYVGDVIDRGDNSLDALDDVYNSTVLMGNHEDMFLKYQNKDKNGMANYLIPTNGGLVFLEEIYNHVPKSHLNDLINRMQKYLIKYEKDNLIITHTPYREDVHNGEDEQKKLWSIKEPQNIEGKLTIHGHTNRYLINKYNGENSYGANLMGKEDYDKWTKELSMSGDVIITKESVTQFKREDGTVFSLGIDAMHQKQLCGVVIDSVTLEYKSYCVDNAVGEFDRHQEIVAGDAWGEAKHLIKTKGWK